MLSSRRMHTLFFTAAAMSGALTFCGSKPRQPDCDKNCYGRGGEILRVEKGPGWGKGDNQVDCICLYKDGRSLPLQFDGGI